MASSACVLCELMAASPAWRVVWLLVAHEW